MNGGFKVKSLAMVIASSSYSKPKLTWVDMLDFESLTDEQADEVATIINKWRKKEDDSEQDYIR